MRRSISILFFAPCLALAQGVQYSPGQTGYQPGAGMLPSQSAAILDVRFNTCGTSPTVVKGGPLTVSRASAQIATTQNCSVTAGANQLAVTPRGAAIYGSGANGVSNSLNTSMYHGSATATTETTDPMGGTSALKVCDDTNNSIHVVYPNVFEFGASNLASVYMKPGTKTWGGLTPHDALGIAQTFNLSTCAPGSGNTSGGAESIGNGWCRLWQYDVAQYQGNLETGPANGDGAVVYAGDGAGCVYVWGIQGESFSTTGIRHPGPHQPTSGTPVSWPATVVTAPAVSMSSWCATARGHSAYWARTLKLISAGTAGGANSFSLGADASSLVFSVFDSAGVERKGTFATPAAGTRTITACRNGTTLTALVDGVTQTVTLSGAGSASFSTAPTPIYLGQDSAGSHFNGEVSRVMLCNSANPSRCK